MGDIKHISELHPLYKHLGDKVLEFSNGMLSGYRVVEYRDYSPERVELERQVPRRDGVTSWDTAYDILYGTPTAPDFGKVLS